MKTLSFGAALIVAAVLAGCQPVPRVATPVATPVVEPPADPAQRLRALREAAGDPGVVDVQPLRSPELEDLREAVDEAESRGDITTARSLLAQALALEPGQPELLQTKAELLLVDGELFPAIEQATQALNAGPRVGSLCRRSWLTLVEAYRLGGHAAEAELALGQLERCSVPAPVRM